MYPLLQPVKLCLVTSLFHSAFLVCYSFTTANIFAVLQCSGLKLLMNDCDSLEESPRSLQTVKKHAHKSQVAESARLLSLLEGIFWQRGTGWSWQYPGSFYCHCKEPLWNKYHCSLFLLEQFLNFLFPGQTKDLKYFQDVLVLSWTTKEPADFVLSFFCSRKECGSLLFGFLALHKDNLLRLKKSVL